MGDNCCCCSFRDDCDKSDKKDICPECGCDPCECEDADDKNDWGKKEEK